MIKDKIANWKLYANCHPEFAKAFKILLELPADLENGDTMFGDIKRAASAYETKPASAKKLEAHKKFIDIQYIIDGEEKFFFGDKSKFKTSIPYSDEKDVEFFFSDDFEKSAQAEFSVLHAGEFAVFFPDDAHKPSLDTDKPHFVKKVILKIPV